MLRFVVFTIGGLTIATLVSLLRVTDFQARPDAVTNAIADLASLGLLVVNGESANRVRVEHELVAQLVSEITPEDEKLELRAQAVIALSTVLDEGASSGDEAVLYDRLLGIVNDIELRQTPSLLSHVVRFVQMQGEFDRHRYLSGICRDSVCWDVLDALPDITIRALLDAIQKSALFSFGLVATARLRRSSSPYESLASLYEAKYLVQLFRYEEAASALERVDELREKRAVGSTSCSISLRMIELPRSRWRCMRRSPRRPGASRIMSSYVTRSTCFDRMIRSSLSRPRLRVPSSRSPLWRRHGTEQSRHCRTLFRLHRLGEREFRSGSSTA